MKDPFLVLIRTDKSGRRGKVVTRVENLPLHPEGKRTVLKELQQRCGAGGTVKDGALEIQGDHRARVGAYLESLGHRVKIAP
jgi:translation initiation factor 1